MKNIFWFIRFLGFAAVIGFTLLGCATINSKNVEAGKIFTAYYGRYDMRKQLDEQCFLINLSRHGNEFFSITNIDNKIIKIGGRILPSQITVLQPGTRTIRWRFEDPKAATGGTYHTGTGELTFEFEPGQYYFFDGKRVRSEAIVEIKNINNTDRIYVQEGFSSEFIPSESIIAGIDKAIDSGMRTGFSNSIVKTFDKNIPVEQQATLFIDGQYWNVKVFSGKKVKWHQRSPFKSTIVTIPSGQHTMKFDFLKAKNVELTTNFLAGYRYGLNYFLERSSRKYVLQLINLTTGDVVQEIKR